MSVINEIFHQPTEPNRSEGWLDESSGSLELKFYGSEGWESIGLPGGEKDPIYTADKPNIATKDDLNEYQKEFTAGANITIDNTDPNNPIISATGTLSGAAADVTVNQNTLTNITGANVQAALESIDSQLDPTASDIPVDNTSFTEIAGNNVQETLESIDTQLGIPPTAAEVTVDTTNFQELTGTNVQANLEEIDAALLNVPSTRPINRYDITSLFTTSTPVNDFVVELVVYQNTKPLVIMRGQDTSGLNNTLTITAPRGFGSYYNFTGTNSRLMLGRDSNNSAGIYTVDITLETSTVNTTVTFSPEIRCFELFYWIAYPYVSNISYYIDNTGIAHRFGAINTPVTNFSNPSSSDTTEIVINNIRVPKRNIYQLYFGDDYDNITITANYFLFYFTNLVTVKLPIINNTSIGIGSLMRLGRLTSIDLNPFNSITSIGGSFLTGAFTLQSLDLSSLTSLSTIDESRFCEGCTGLTEIQIGNLNFNIITVTPSLNTGFSGVLNVSTSILRADTQALADAFKAKFPNISNWTVVLN